MPIYPYRCADCEVTLELQYPMGSAPATLQCPYCEGKMRQDYKGKQVQFMGVKSAYREENELTEEDKPTPEALEALHRFAERSQPARRESGNITYEFQFGGE